MSREIEAAEECRETRRDNYSVLACDDEAEVDAEATVSVQSARSRTTICVTVSGDAEELHAIVSWDLRDEAFGSRLFRSLSNALAVRSIPLSPLITYQSISASSTLTKFKYVS